MYHSCPLCKSEAKFKYEVNSYKYYLCNRCTTLFLFPFPNQSQVNDYYKKAFEYSAAKPNEKIIRNQASIIINRLIKLNPSGVNLLDIGSGYGYLVSEANKKGIHAIGIEPSGKLANASESNKILNCTFDEYLEKHTNDKYDFITLVHVIEHVNNPKRLVKSALKLLNKGGILFIETPNLDSHLYYAEKVNYTFLTPPDHIWLFSRHSLSNLFPNEELIKISTYSYPEHLMGVIKYKIKDTIGKSKTEKTKTESTNTSSNYQTNSSSLSLEKKAKYLIFDRIFARIFYPLLNINYLGSILELYIKKK